MGIEHYIKVVTSSIFKAFPFNIYLTTSSSARPKTHTINPTKPPKPAGFGFF